MHQHQNRLDQIDSPTAPRERPAAGRRTLARWSDVARGLVPDRPTGPTEAENKQRNRRWAIYLAVGISIFTGYFLVRVSSQAIDVPVGDWGVYYRAGEALLAGQSPYSLQYGPCLTFKNAPIVATAIVPLAMLPPLLARWIWCLLDVALVGLIVWLGVRIVEGDGNIRAKTWWLAWGAAGLSIRYIMNQMHAGSTTTLWVALILGAFYLMQRGRMFAAGGVLAMAIAWKLVPICFVPYLLLRRRATLGFAGLLLAGGAMFIVPVALLGWNQNINVHALWPEHLTSTEIPKQVWRIQNQSVYAQLSRLLAPSTYGSQMADWPREQVRNLWLVVSCTTAAILYGAFWLTNRRRGRETHPCVHLAMLLIYMTVCNPLAWRYNFVALIFPYFLVLYGLSEGGPHRRLRIGLLVAGFVLASFPSHGPWPIESLHAAGDRLWGTLLLGIAVVLTAPSLVKREASHFDNERSSWEMVTSTPSSAIASPKVHSVA